MNTYDELIGLLASEFGLDPATLDPDKRLAQYGLDSLALVELMFTVEEHFHVDLPNDGTPFETLAELAALIDRLRIRQAA